MKRCSICGYRGPGGHWQRDCPQNPANKLQARVDAAELIRTSTVEGGVELVTIRDGSLRAFHAREELKLLEFTWNECEKAWIRVELGDAATVLDLVRAGAVIAELIETDGTTACRVRAGRCPLWKLGKLLRREGFVNPDDGACSCSAVDVNAMRDAIAASPCDAEPSDCSGCKRKGHTSAFCPTLKQQRLEEHLFELFRASGVDQVRSDLETLIPQTKEEAKRKTFLSAYIDAIDRSYGSADASGLRWQRVRYSQKRKGAGRRQAWGTNPGPEWANGYRSSVCLQGMIRELRTYAVGQDAHDLDFKVCEHRTLIEPCVMRERALRDHRSASRRSSRSYRRF